MVVDLEAATVGRGLALQLRQVGVEAGDRRGRTLWRASARSARSSACGQL